MSVLLSHAPRGFQKFLLGDMNVESRPDFQDSDMCEKWDSLLASTSSRNLVPALPQGRDVVSRIPKGLSALVSDHSYIDHCFIPLT